MFLSFAVLLFLRLSFTSFFLFFSLKFVFLVLVGFLALLGWSWRGLDGHGLAFFTIIIITSSASSSSSFFCSELMGVVCACSDAFGDSPELEDVLALHDSQVHPEVRHKDPASDRRVRQCASEEGTAA